MQKSRIPEFDSAPERREFVCQFGRSRSFFLLTSRRDRALRSVVSLFVNLGVQKMGTGVFENASGVKHVAC